MLIARFKVATKPLLSLFILCLTLVANTAWVQAAVSLSPEEKAWLERHKVLKIGITPDWAPFEFYDDQNNVPSGFSTDLLRLLLKPYDIKIVVETPEDTWDKVMKKLQSSQIDMVTAIYISDDREKLFNFSQPYLEVPHVIFVREDRTAINSMNDLKNFKLAYVLGWVGQELLRKEFPEIRLSLNEKMEGMIGQVLLGTADAGLIDLASLSYYSRMHNLAALKVAVKAPFAPDLAFGFPKHDTVGAELFNKLLKSASKADVELLKQKWLFAGSVSDSNYRLVGRIIAIVLLTALFTFVWNLLLRRRIKERTQALEIEVEKNRRHVAALEESEGKIRAFFDQTFQFIGLLSVDGILLDANKSALAFIDSDKESVVGRRFSETPWWSHSEDLRRQLEDAICRCAAGDTLRFNTTNRDAKGRTSIIDFSLNPCYDSSGKIVYLIAEGRDISSLHETMRSLKESEERFRLIFENSPDAAWLVRKSGFFECNQAAVKLFGCSSKQELLQKLPDSLSPEFQPDGRRSSEAAELWVEKAFLEDVVRFEWEHLSSDGSLLPMEITLSRVRLKNEDVLYGTGRDLRTRRKIEESRKLLEAQFLQSQKMESVGRLAGGIAHDFNNLLTVMRGFSELIMMQFKLPEKAVEMMSEIVKAVNSASNLTRQLLTFSRKQVSEPREVNLNSLIQNLEKMLTRILGEDVDLNIFLGKSPGICFVDPGQVEQVLVNLAANARDAMPDGGSLVIETSRIFADFTSRPFGLTLPAGSYLKITVRDTGCGMTEEVREHLFEPFYTTKPPEKGTGLGLATVYGIVKQSGGYVAVETAPGKGTAFHLFLPVTDGGLNNSTPGASAVAHGSGQLIMVVEDDQVLRQLVALGLPQFGYKVEVFADGRSALLWLEQSAEMPPVLLVTDVVMPDMSGNALVENVSRFFPDMPVLYLSGYSRDVVTDHGVCSQKSDFLAKPFSITALVGKITEILNRRKL